MWAWKLQQHRGYKASRALCRSVVPKMYNNIHIKNSSLLADRQWCTAHHHHMSTICQVFLFMSAMMQTCDPNVSYVPTKIGMNRLMFYVNTQLNAPHVVKHFLHRKTHRLVQQITMAEPAASAWITCSNQGHRNDMWRFIFSNLALNVEWHTYWVFVLVHSIKLLSYFIDIFQKQSYFSKFTFDFQWITENLFLKSWKCNKMTKTITNITIFKNAAKKQIRLFLCSIINTLQVCRYPQITWNSIYHFKMSIKVCSMKKTIKITYYIYYGNLFHNCTQHTSVERIIN